jgi:hypothetical protein
MLKKLFGRFQKTPEPKKGEELLLSKIDKHMNFLLRDKLGYINKSITSKILEINTKRDETLLNLRTLHKSKLMNANIPEREIHIMDGNRDNYIKKISHLIMNISVPKNYLDTHDYCVKFSQDLEQLNRDIQKNIFVLQHFFANEVKDVNKSMHELEELIIEIRVMLEKNGIAYLKNVQQQMKLFVDNALKIKSFTEQIDSEKSEINSHQEKVDRLNDRIKTITSGTDYKALEGFKQEKETAEKEIKEQLKTLEESFSSLDTALKKHYYMYPDKKIIKEYLEDIRTAILNDKNISIIHILQDIKKAIENNEIDLKDKKKEHCLESIQKLNMEYIKDKQSKIMKLEDEKQRAQTKITHNSASLNLSEQQYWIKATEDKIQYHQSNIDKLERNINAVTLENARIMLTIKSDLENIMGKTVELKDDISSDIISGRNILEQEISEE